MIKFISLLLVVVSMNAIGQNKENQTVLLNKADRVKAKELKDLLSVLPDDATQVKYELVGKVQEKVTVANGDGTKLNETFKNILINADTGSKLYLDVKYTSSGMVNSKTIAFKVSD